MSEQQKMRPNGLFRMPVELAGEQERLNPFPWFERMRATAPVRWDEVRNCWDVFLYDDLQTIFADPKTFSSVSPSDLEGPQSISILTMDPPRHTKLRGVVAKSFTPKEIARWGPTVQSITHDLFAAARDGGEIELVSEFSYPLPIIVITEMIGIHSEDRMLFRNWINTLFVGAAADDTTVSIEDNVKKQMLARQDLAEYFLQLFADRRRQPREDLITQLLFSEVDGERLTDFELLEFCTLLMIGGFETTANLISNGVRTFLEHPDALERLRKQPELMPKAVEEVLRMRPSVLSGCRYVTRDVELSGQTIRAGEQIVQWMGSANRDESRFSNPNTFDIERTPNPHVSFGGGTHFCLGSVLARMEGVAALSALIQLPNLRFADPSALKPQSSTLAYGLLHFPLAFD